jgi:N-ethylmaleimide reductase
MGAPAVPAEIKTALRQAFDGPFVLAGGFDHASAEKVLQDKQADLVAFGRPFVANPDLVQRMKTDVTMNELDMGSLYTPDAKGYTDYPALA